jgi:hypothetical protein
VRHLTQQRIYLFAGSQRAKVICMCGSASQPCFATGIMIIFCACRDSLQPTSCSIVLCAPDL